MTNTSTFTKTEQEIIVLRAVWDMIFGMVNYDHFDKDHTADEAQLMFNSNAHRRLFSILLADFLSKPKKGAFGLPEVVGSEKTDHTFLFYLRRICNEPQFNSDSSHLRQPVDAFANWLEGEGVIEKVWLPSIDTETAIRAKRMTLLKLCGNSEKHGFARLQENVQIIKQVLKANGVSIDEGQGYLLLPELHHWIEEVFYYHSTTISEYLNNIRWGIYRYLRPEFTRSYEETRKKFPLPPYYFNYPVDCHLPVAKTMYWDLMIEMRKPPFFPRFTTSPYLKMHF